MTTAPTTPDEAARLSALEELELLDSRGGERFGRIVRLAQRLFDVPVVTISLIDADREWFLACEGLQGHEGPRAQSFCAHTILDGETLIVEDATRDSRFAENAQVLDSPGVRFYAGHPVRGPGGHRIGALSIRDFEPREFGDDDRSLLVDLARWVEDEIRLGRVARLEREVLDRAAAQQRAEKQYDKFIELSIDLLCIADFDGYFRVLSPSWEWVTGYSIEELLAKPFIEFVHPEDREETVAEATSLAEGGVTVDFENRYVCKDGSMRWLYWSGVPDPEERLIYAVARDVTQRKEWEEAISSAKEAAELASKAKSEFLASMSHELRTPLNSVIGFANVLLADKALKLSEKQQGYLDRIRQNGEHLLQLINEVLDLARIEAGRVEIVYEEIDLVDLVRQVVAQFEPQVAGSPTELRSETGKSTGTFVTDHRLLRQILINLVGNAVKFTPSGSVTVRSTASEDGTTTAIIVEDTGVGIPDDKLETIFDDFEQVDSGIARSFQGTGLGLSICRSLCELLGYQLTVESELGKGSAFTLHLREPELEESAERAVSDSQALSRDLVRQVESAERDGVSFDDKLVLVIDDDPDSRLILSQCLHELGCQVLTATSGGQGAQLAREHGPDLITLDLLMPHTNGWQILARFKQDAKLRDIPVVIVSSAAAEYRHSVVGAAGILEKPVDASTMKRELERNLPPKSGRVLIVDDNPDDRSLLSDYLCNGDTECRLASSGEEALEVLDSFSPDLAIIDLLMPGMDGAELIERIRRRAELRDLPVLIVTAKDLDRDDLERLSRASAAVVLKGPNLRGDLNEICWKLWRTRAGQKRPEADSL